MGAAVKVRAPVSVIIPCYRCVDTIQRAVDSVIGQTLLPEEILLVEDCSNDEGGTLAALQRVQQLYPQENIRVIPLQKNCGPGGARNAGWELAQQPYLAFLDADDSWHPKKLELQYAWMVAHPEVVMTGHHTVCLPLGAPMPAIEARLEAHPVNGRALLVSNRFPTRTVMLRRTISNRFDPVKRYAEDYLVWLRIVLSGGSAWLIELPLAYSYKADFGATGLTANLWKMEKGEIDTYHRIHREGLISSPMYFFLVLFSLLKFLRRLVLSGT
jgi:glycosyltransferase involved in cell wall biosynthesis